MRITLYGFMGSGKTLLGKRLAGKMGYNFVDLDEEIEKKAGISISSIFKEKGEIFFRNLEHNTLKEIVKKNEQNVILALGGGTIIRPSNRELLKVKNFKTIYLDVEIEELIKRLRNDKENRPLLKNIENDDFSQYVKALFLTRKSVYETNADIKISIHKENIEQALEKIYLYLNLN